MSARTRVHIGVHRQQRRACQRQRGFTLLEVILAMGVLACIALMVAILWSTLVRWQGDAADQQERMRLQRVTDLLREQWADRRMTRSMMAGGREYQIDDRTVSFVTTIPILFPDWPLVAVSYTIERSQAAGSSTRHALVYQERRITDVTAPPPPDDRDEQGRLLIRRMVLIDGASELAWQRFGRGDKADAAQTSDQADESSDETQRSGLPGSASQRSAADAGRASDRSGGRRSLSGGSSESSSVYATDSVLRELDLHRPDRRTDLDDPDLDRWRPINPKFRGRVNAVRLVGQVPPVLPLPRVLRTDERFDEQWMEIGRATGEQELFACVLIVMGSP